MKFKDKLSSYTEKINAYLNNAFPESTAPEANIHKAMKYSIDAGGKRLRPVLSLAVCQLLEGNEDQVIPYACALEMIHTYSLIHDDLPSMDDDDMRRGRPTNHKVFGEATAILAGDGLLNYAFETMLEASLKNPENMVSKVKAMNIIASASGVRGMIAGQVVDMESEGKIIEGELLKYMHKCKTGALIKAGVLLSAAILNATPEEYEALSIYSEKIGLAFQIKDDILDVEGNEELLGKPIGSDKDNLKSTFVTVYGLDESKKALEAVSDEAIGSLDLFGEKADFLKKLALYLVNREN